MLTAPTIVDRLRLAHEADFRRQWWPAWKRLLRRAAAFTTARRRGARTILKKFKDRARAAAEQLALVEGDWRGFYLFILCAPFPEPALTEREKRLLEAALAVGILPLITVGAAERGRREKRFFDEAAAEFFWGK